MAVTPPLITNAILAAGSGMFPGSHNFPKIAQAVGMSVPVWLPLPVNVLALGVTTGISGGGNAQGKMFFTPAGQVVGALTSVGYLGPEGPRLGLAVEIGVSTALNSSAQYQGLSVGVSAGTDVTKIIFSNSATLTPILLANLTAVGMVGVNTSSLALGLATGIGLLVFTGFGLGGVIPVAPIPIPGAGVSTSNVF